MISTSNLILKPISPSVSKALNNYVYALCELLEDGIKKPFYIGRGKGNRCLQHLVNKDDKFEKISQLVKSKNS